MKKKNVVKLGVLSLTIATCLVGCNTSAGIADSGSSNYSSNGLMKSSYMEESLEYSEDYSGSDSYTDYDSDYSSSEADVVKNTMMIVRDASLSLDVKNLEEFDNDLHNKVEELGGYFEDATINDYSSEYSTDRYAYYTVRLPQAKLDTFLSIIDGASTITSKTVTSEDVSLEYVDINAHISALENEKNNLLRLLDQAEDVSDIIEIENRLSDVQYQLDSVNGQKRLLEGRVSYSTININAHEERNVEHPIIMALNINLKQSMIDGIENAASTFIGIIASIPVITIITGFVILFLWIVRKIWRKVFRTGKHIHYMFVPVEDVEVNKDKVNKNNTNESMNNSNNDTDCDNTNLMK